jgi:predicted nucleic acid-binding protein
VALLDSIVIDANVAIGAILPRLVAAPQAIATEFSQWLADGTTIYVPGLWLAECTTAIRRYVHVGILSSNEAVAAVDDLLTLGVQVVLLVHSQCRAALSWAERLGQSRAYDGFYLALAEELGAPLFTADRRLYNSAQRLGLDWINLLGVDR